MRFFERHLYFGLLLISLPLLFLPKINIISVESETAGLRVDDLILFIVGALLMWSHVLSNKRLQKVEILILLITICSVLSFLTNSYFVSINTLYNSAKIFYAVRFLEYFIFFYIGCIAYRFVEGRVVIRLFLIWNIVLMVLQKLNLAGGVSSEGYHSVSERVQGVASFPSEMGLILNLLFCYMIYDESLAARFLSLFSSPIIRNWLRKTYLYWLFSIFGIFVIFTGNRISIIALLVSFFWRIKSEFRIRSLGSVLMIIILIPLLLSGVGYIISQTASVYERSADLFSMKNLELAQIVWEKIDISKDPLLGGTEVISADDYDMSWWIRIHKWIFILRAYLSNPETYLLGVGPGYAGAALDGGILRIVAELGIIGTTLFILFFKSLYQINKQTAWMIIVFMINMIFFDAYLAYKTMSVLFFMCGYAFEEKRRSEKKALKELGLDKKHKRSVIEIKQAI